MRTPLARPVRPLPVEPADRARARRGAAPGPRARRSVTPWRSWSSPVVARGRRRELAHRRRPILARRHSRQARKALRQHARARCPATASCERAERLISDRLDGALRLPWRGAASTPICARCDALRHPRAAAAPGARPARHEPGSTAAAGRAGGPAAAAGGRRARRSGRAGRDRAPTPALVRARALAALAVVARRGARRRGLDYGRLRLPESGTSRGAGARRLPQQAPPLWNGAGGTSTPRRLLQGHPPPHGSGHRALSCATPPRPFWPATSRLCARRWRRMRST